VTFPSPMHGRRSVGGSEWRKAKWLANGGLEKAKKALAWNTSTTAISALFATKLMPVFPFLATVTITPAEYPGDFVQAPINADNVTKKIAKLFPGLIPHDLPCVTEEGHFLVPTPPNILASNPLHPPYLIVGCLLSESRSTPVQDSSATSW
jgi:hypothetical protein